MNPLLIRQLSADFCCTEAEVSDTLHHFSVFMPRPDRRLYQEIRPCLLKIAVVNGKLLFTGREDIIARCRELYQDANAPWFMEITNIAGLNRELAPFGARVRHARPFFTADRCMPVDTAGMEIVRFAPEAICKRFRGDDRWGEAFGFDEDSPDMIGIGAMIGGELVGMAGASADSPYLWQIGINVIPEARGRNIASTLVALIRNDILDEGRLPFYGTSISHLASQRVALRSGFLPAWFELVAAPLDGE